ncbi:hypothetical protein E4U14_003995 [Claviceps sp. LM454 group G7]|nr:hypothetical protein E4U14_003995 [Claviceps sp. LM454 group G7]
MNSSLTSFLFAIFFVSVTATKLLRLYLNAHGFPVLVFVVCLPAFFLADVILISAVWALVCRKNGGLGGFFGFAVGCVICLVTLGAASSQLGFYYHTGGELDWGDATKFAFSEDGRKVLLSEGATPLSFACAILLLSWIVKSRLSKLVSIVVSSGAVHARSALRWVATRTYSNSKSNKAETESSLLPTREYDSDSDFLYDSDDANTDITHHETPGQSGNENVGGRAIYCPRFVTGGYTMLVLLALLCIFTIFNHDRPYDRMFTTLPLPLLAIFAPKSVECSSSSWPLPALIEKVRWEKQNGNYKGWAPGSANEVIENYRQRMPDWLPSDLPYGFARWSQDSKSEDVQTLLHNTTLSHDDGCADPLILDPYYNPANDPMKITNLDNPFLEPLQQIMQERSVKIKHIALILMESMREELFPLQQGTGFHDLILKSHDELDHDDINELLSHISPNSERITGLEGNWMGQNGTSFGRQFSEWNDETKPGFGGINIRGALTTSSVSTKSLAAVHCGTWPLAVDMFEEAEAESYQPCLPQVLELFNRIKANTSSDDFREQQWYPAFFQAVTDGYDRQDKFDDKMGFKHIVNKNRIKQDALANPELEEINYFGFPETALKSYITDYITNATANNQRMFMSHFTSTTHHPWATPKWFNASEYMGTAHGLMQTHKDLNSYLNTVRFTDAWIGQLMQILDEQGISNETLVVFVGDHGQAFKEDISKTGTYGNPHISNHRVPITFRHPQLPRVQHQVNATSLSILPTILDLLVSTDSLNPKDTAAAADLVQDYEGQSLIRPFKTTHKGRRAWNYSLVNPGGRMLTITSSDTPWRLVLPLDKKTEYIFSDLGSDPMELERVLEWSLSSLASTVRRKHSEEAAAWLREAEKVGLWWASERKRLWKYNPS